MFLNLIDMALRRIEIAVECADDAQRDRVQGIMNEVSGMRLLDGAKIEGAYPFLKAHWGDLRSLFGLVQKGGIKSLMSGQGIGLMTKLARR